MEIAYFTRKNNNSSEKIQSFRMFIFINLTLKEIILIFTVLLCLYYLKTPIQKIFLIWNKVVIKCITKRKHNSIIFKLLPWYKKINEKYDKYFCMTIFHLEPICEWDKKCQIEDKPRNVINIRPADNKLIIKLNKN